MFKKRKLILVRTQVSSLTMGETLAEQVRQIRQKETREVLKKALCRLDGRRRKAMEMYLRLKLQDRGPVPYREIADEVGISIATVCRARIALQKATTAELGYQS